MTSLARSPRTGLMAAAFSVMCFLPTLVVTNAVAQSYPNKPIRMVVPFAAGGSVDVLGRVIADRVALALGQSVVGDNRIGANGTIAHQMVATAPPDGYTIGMSGTSPLVLAPHQYKSLPYDSRKDFTYLACAGTTPFVLDVIPPCR